jgi:hypothetical protein
MKTRNYQRSLVNNWNDIDWNKAETNLADLQYKILKAHRRLRAIWRKNGIID